MLGLSLFCPENPDLWRRVDLSRRRQGFVVVVASRLCLAGSCYRNHLIKSKSERGRSVLRRPHQRIHGVGPKRGSWRRHPQAGTGLQ